MNIQNSIKRKVRKLEAAKIYLDNATVAKEEADARVVQALKAYIDLYSEIDNQVNVQY